MKTNKAKYKKHVESEQEEQKFGNLTAVGIREMDCITLWACICACGNRRVVEEKRLFSGIITQCIPCELRAG